MKINNLLFYVYLSAIFSIFIPIAVYPIFFLIFIYFNTLSILSEKKILIINNLFILNIMIILFILIASFSFFSNLSNSDHIQYLKIIINFIFLINVGYYIDSNTHIFLAKRKIFQNIFELIIILSFIQIIINVHSVNFWLIPFIGVENSVMAYKIVEAPILFGTTEKNIWATKIAFIQIIYFSFIYFKYFNVKNIKLYIFWLLSIFNIVYTFSRTAQLVFLLFITAFIIWKIFYIYKKILLKILSISFFLLISIPILFVIYDKLFHITLGSGDGMSARLELWEALYINLNNMNIYTGNGILYAKYVISTFTSWTNNNFHNVFLNTFADEGIIGLLLYILILRMVFFSYKLNKVSKRFIFLVLFLPFFACINSQYLGYDSDIVIYFSLVLLISKYLQFNNKVVSK